MKAISSCIRFIVLSNLFLSVCVTCFTAKTSLILFGNNGNLHVNLLVFFLTLFFYGFHGFYPGLGLPAESNDLKIKSGKNPPEILYYYIIVIACIGAITQLLFMPSRIWFILLPAAAIAFGYSIPFIKTGNRIIRLRDILWLKVFWIALTYAWLTTFLPIAYILPFKGLLQPGVLFIFTRNFLFVFALAIPFDIRDMKTDLVHGVKTLPVLLGIKGAIRVALLLLLAFMVTTLLQVTMYHIPVTICIALLLSAIEAALVIPLTTPEKSNLFFPFAIESSMLLQWVLLFIFLSIKI